MPAPRPPARPPPARGKPARPSGGQLRLDLPANGPVLAWLRGVCEGVARPSAAELLAKLVRAQGPKARWSLRDAAEALAGASGPGAPPRGAREWLAGLLTGGSLDAALGGAPGEGAAIASTVDALLRRSALYRHGAAAQEMIQFLARFREYKPYNLLLVRTQNPSCGYFATAKTWRDRFGRRLIEDARPMLILAPMHPVILVYDLDQTEELPGKAVPLPQKLREFNRVTGRWDPEALDRLLANAGRLRIRVAFKTLSSTHAGFAEWLPAGAGWKYRVVVHDGLDSRARFGVLCHELAHVLLGHLGADPDGWWPGRAMPRAAVEVEAEVAAWLCVTRQGLESTSAAYLSSYVGKIGAGLPEAVSLDMVAKVAGRLEDMAGRVLPAPRLPAAPARAAGAGVPPTGDAVSPLDALVAAVRTAWAYDPRAEAAPEAVLWCDPEQDFAPLLPLLRRALPNLLTLGAWDAAHRQGPAPWLRAAAGGAVPDVAWEGGAPAVLYLPGVARDALRAAADCPDGLRLLAWYTVAGTAFAHPNGRDWTLRAFLTARTQYGGLGLDIPGDDATSQALAAAAQRLFATPVAELQGKRLDAAWLHALLAPDLAQDALDWLGGGLRAEDDPARHAAFRARAKAELKIDPAKGLPRGCRRADAAARCGLVERLGTLRPRRPRPV